MVNIPDISNKMLGIEQLRVDTFQCSFPRISGKFCMLFNNSRHRIWQQAPKFKGLNDLNDWLEQRCLDLWQSMKHPEMKDRTIAQVYAVEREQLMPVPTPFDGFVEHSKRVSSTCLITFDNNRYSVPATFANRPVSLRVYADRLVIVAEAQVVAEHKRVFTRDHSQQGRAIYDWRHYLSVVQRKPGALRNGAPFKQLPGAFLQLQKQLLKHTGGDREMVEVLALVLQHDEDKVEQAIREALHSGSTSKQHVINCLNRLLDVAQPAPVKTPPALRLIKEPQADTGRYDRLRRKSHVR